MRRLPKWARVVLATVGTLAIVGVVSTLVAYIASDKVKNRIDNAINALKDKETTSEKATIADTPASLVYADNLVVVTEA